MSRKGENIYKRKDGRWEARVIVSHTIGKAEYISVYGRTYGEAKQKKIEILRAGDQRELDCSSIFNDLAQLWLDAEKMRVKESSYSRYSYSLKNYILPEIGSIELSKLTANTILQFSEKLLCNGRKDGSGGLSGKTVADTISIIKNIVLFGKRHGYRIDCDLSMLSIKRKDQPIRVLSSSEQKRLEHILLNDIDSVKLGVLLSLYTGIRIGELCALRWKNISIESKTLTVSQTLQRIQNTSSSGCRTKVIISTPKSACSIRSIPIPKCLIQTIERFRSSPEAFVLTGDINRYMEPRTIQNRFHHYLDESGITSINFHALRHTFATRCIEVGFDIKSLSEILGHAKVDITLNRYVHSSLELKEANMNRLNFHS